MEKLRRNIWFTIISIILLITICIPSYAADFVLNRDKLESAFKTIFTTNTDDNWEIQEGAYFKEITGSTVKFEVDGEIVEMNYQIKGRQAVFSKSVEITDGMDYETYEEKTGNLSMPLVGYIAVSEAAGVELEKSLTYMLISMLESAFGSIDFSNPDANPGYMIVEDNVQVDMTEGLKVIKKSEFGKYAMEYAEYNYKDSMGYSDSNGYNTYSLEYKTSKTSRKYTIDCIVTVNLDGDFAKINELDLDENSSSEDLIGQVNKSKIAEIETKVLETVKLACDTAKETITEGFKNNEKYSIETSMPKIQEVLLRELKSETAYLEPKGWRIDNSSSNGTFLIVYEGETYKALKNDENAKIEYSVVIGEKTIEVLTPKVEDGEKHNFEEKVTIKPTCTTIGAKLYTCTDCNNSYAEAVNELGHDYSSSITTEPTCVKQGVKTYKCSRCTASYGEPVEMGEHNYVERMRTERDCEKDAIIGYVCADCGGLYSKVIAKAKGHSYDVVEKKATCEAAGAKVYTCITCGDTYNEFTSQATGHDYVEEQLPDGSKKYTCKNCNKSYTDKIPTSSNTNNTVQEPDIVNIDNSVYVIIGAAAGAIILVIAIIVVSIRKREV